MCVKKERNGAFAHAPIFQIDEKPRSIQGIPEAIKEEPQLRNHFPQTFLWPRKHKKSSNCQNKLQNKVIFLKNTV